MLVISEENRISLKKHIFDLFMKAGPISVIYISNTLLFNFKRGLIAKNGVEALEAHIIARTIAELCTLPVPLLWSQTPVRVANLFGIIKAGSLPTDRSMPSNEIERVTHNEGNNINLYDDIGMLARQSYTFSILASIPVAIILISTRHSWISTFNNTENANNLAAGYLLIYSVVILPDYINTMTEGFLSAVDQEKWIIPIRILSGAVDIGVAFWLIPNNPLKGDAYSTLARNLISVFLSILLFNFYPSLKKFNIICFRWGNFNNMRKVLTESWPYSIYQLTQSGVTYLLSLLMGRLGSGRLAAYQVPNALFEIASSINFSFSESANRIVAQYYGSYNFKETMRVGNISLIANTLIYSINAIGINLLQYQLANLFLNKEDIIEYSSVLRFNFIILAFVNLFKMLFDNSNRILSGVDDTIYCGLVWLISSLALTLPLSAISTYLTNFDMYGIAAAIGIGALASGVLGLSYWLIRSNGIIETNNNYRSSNQVISELVSRIGIFSCSNKSRSNYIDAEQKTEQDLLVIEENTTYSGLRNEIEIRTTP